MWHNRLLMESNSNDLATEQYWDKNWKAEGLPRKIHPYKYPIQSRQANVFKQYLPRGGRFLEIGCGGSAWMPFFAETMNCELWGVDYSKPGLELAHQNLKLLGQKAHLVLGDYIQVDLPLNSFRIIFSRGVIEHYADPSPLFCRSFELLEPGGFHVTIIPNMAGLPGWVTKKIDRKVYDVHVPFRPADLDRFQQAAGFESVVASRAFGVFYLGVINWKNTFDRMPPFLARSMAYLFQVIDFSLGWGSWPFDRILDSELTSPYYLSIYRKPK